MKIRTITCHDVYNLGASLQAFALQHYLESQGHEVEIIDYKPDYLSNHYKLWAVANAIYDKPLLKQLYLLAKLPERLLALKRKKVFDAFTAKHLHLTRRYNSYDELKANPPQADAFIAGSDQIWNTIFLNGRDKAFYLDFGSFGNTQEPNKVKRISYAASFATPDIVPEYREFVKEQLKNLDACSIREKTSLPLLRSLGREDGVAVCDPVFLLSKDEWEKRLNAEGLVDKYGKEKYILVYLTDKSEQIKNIAIEAKKATGWKIYLVGGFKEKYADKNFTNAGPLEFVSLIKNSQFVISNSFHATAFSLIMERNFCVVNRKEGINERMKSVLEDYGLEERMTSLFFKPLLKDIDYLSVNAIKDKIITNSKEWLQIAINK